MTKHTIKWFKNRIGKRIYRNKLKCSCKDCVDVTHNGLTIRDEQHAIYLENIQRELDINYKDKQ